MIDERLVICAVVSLVGHFAIARALDELPPREPSAPPRKIAVRVVQPPPPPPPEPVEPPEPVKPPEPIKPPVHVPPRPRPPAVTATVDPSPVEPPPAPVSSAAGDPAARPRYGVTMDSTSQAGQTAVPTGNTTAPAPPSSDPRPAQPLAVAAAHEVTRMPLPQGSCAGTYTDEARAAGVEGVVVLDVIVDEAGRTRDIQVVEGLGHGLTGAAIAALRACRFTPGERNGQPVPVRVRGFKIRFLLQDGAG